MHRGKDESRHIASPTNALHVICMESVIKMRDFVEFVVYNNGSNNCSHIQSIISNIKFIH